MREQLSEILDYTLVDTTFLVIDVRWIATFVFYLLAASVTLLLIKRLLRLATQRGWWMGTEREEAVYNSVKFPVFLILIEETLSLFKPDNLLSQIFHYPLFNSEKVTISPRSVLLFISVILLMRFFITLIEFVIHRSVKRKPWINRPTEYNLLKLNSYLLYLVAIFIGIRSIGLDISILLGASAALLVGIGFGLQDIFRDFVSGILILFEGNFKVGDIIQYKDQVGRVSRIDLRTSRMITRDGNRILIPNSILINQEIINWSISNPEIRFSIKVGVAYGSDTAKVSEILKACAIAHEDVVRKDDTMVMFRDFGDSALEFELFFWATKSWNENPIKSDIRFAIDRMFREHAIQIPFPQRDLHLKSDIRTSNQTS
jgi:small-conductance mechanosensitive channel